MKEFQRRIENATAATPAEIAPSQTTAPFPTSPDATLAPSTPPRKSVVPLGDSRSPPSVKEAPPAEAVRKADLTTVTTVKRIAQVAMTTTIVKRIAHVEKNEMIDTRIAH